MKSEQEQIQTFLNNIKDQIMEAKQSYGGCYIAVMDYGGYQELDVEVSDGSIAGSFVCEKSLASARNVADELAERITAETGCHVYLTRSEWEYALESS